MFCPECASEMAIESVRVHRTTDPEHDDVYEDMWWCDACGYSVEIEPEEEDEYDPDADL